MIKFLHKLFNHDKVDAAKNLIQTYRERVEQLESEVMEYKGYKLKYEVAQLYIKDDVSLEILIDSAFQQQAAYFALHGNFGSGGRIITEEHNILMRQLGISNNKRYY